MNIEVKFTTDGKKVVVIGSLNSTEKIVQEIFIVDGSEIPSGEHFVVKSLHDAPAVSWKENELKKLEERYESESKKYQLEIDKNRKQYKDKTNEFRERFSYIASALKKADEKSFELLCDFICGDVNFIVVLDYDIKLLPISEFNMMYEDKLRLFSFFGKDDGTFTYAVGDYYDFSGGNKKFIPFKNYEDALIKFKELVLKSGISEKTLAISEQYNISFPSEAVEKYKADRIAQYNRNIEDYKKSIAKWSLEIENISTL
jgi:hypothetical protein